MIMANLECLLPCATLANTVLSRTLSVPYTALFTHSSLGSPAPRVEPFCQPDPPQSVLLTPPRQAERPTEPPRCLDPHRLCAARGRLGHLLCSLLSDAGATAALSVSSQPSFGSLTSCVCFLLRPCLLCPIVPKTASTFLFQEQRREGQSSKLFSHPFKPLEVQPGTKSTFATPSLAVVFSPLITFFPSYLQSVRRLNYFPEIPFFLHFSKFYCAVITSF